MIAIKNNTYEKFEKNWNKWIVVFEGDIDSVFEGYTNLFLFQSCSYVICFLRSDNLLILY